MEALSLVAGLALGGQAAQASVLTLDWNSLKQGTLTKNGSTYTDLVKLGEGEVKVTVAPSGPVQFRKFGTANLQTPAVTNTIFQGGQVAGTSNLSTVAKFRPSQGSPDPSVTFTIDFLGYKNGVSNVNFDLFDVDRSDNARFIDEVTFQTAGVSLAPGSANALVGNNTVAGTTSSSNLGPASGAGNVGVTYDRVPSRKIVFSYRNIDLGGKDSLQGFGIGNISFAPVPEAGQLVIGLASCALAAFWLRKRTRRKAVSAA